MTEQQNENVAASAEQQPTQQVATETPEQGTPATSDANVQAPGVEQPAPVEPGNDLPTGDPAAEPAEPAGGADPDADATEPNADERELAGDGDVTEPHPYVPGFGVTGKFAEHAGAQDDADDTDGDRA